MLSIERILRADRQREEEARSDFKSEDYPSVPVSPVEANQLYLGFEANVNRPNRLICESFSDLEARLKHEIGMVRFWTKMSLAVNLETAQRFRERLGHRQETAMRVVSDIQRNGLEIKLPLMRPVGDETLIPLGQLVTSTKRTDVKKTAKFFAPSNGVSLALRAVMEFVRLDTSLIDNFTPEELFRQGASHVVTVMVKLNWAVESEAKVDVGGRKESRTCHFRLNTPQFDCFELGRIPVPVNVDWRGRDAKESLLDRIARGSSTLMHGPHIQVNGSRSALERREIYPENVYRECLYDTKDAAKKECVPTYVIRSLVTFGGHGDFPTDLSCQITRVGSTPSGVRLTKVIVSGHYSNRKILFPEASDEPEAQKKQDDDEQEEEAGEEDEEGHAGAAEEEEEGEDETESVADATAGFDEEDDEEEEEEDSKLGPTVSGWKWAGVTTKACSGPVSEVKARVRLVEEQPMVSGKAFLTQHEHQMRSNPLFKKNWTRHASSGEKRCQLTRVVVVPGRSPRHAYGNEYLASGLSGYLDRAAVEMGVSAKPSNAAWASSVEGLTSRVPTLKIVIPIARTKRALPLIPLMVAYGAPSSKAGLLRLIGLGDSPEDLAKYADVIENSLALSEGSLEPIAFCARVGRLWKKRGQMTPEDMASQGMYWLDNIFLSEIDPKVRFFESTAFPMGPTSPSEVSPREETRRQKRLFLAALANRTCRYYAGLDHKEGYSAMHTRGLTTLSKLILHNVRRACGDVKKLLRLTAQRVGPYVSQMPPTLIMRSSLFTKTVLELNSIGDGFRTPTNASAIRHPLNGNIFHQVNNTKLVTQVGGDKVRGKDPRYDPTQWGGLCPARTSKGANSGRDKILASMAVVTPQVPIQTTQLVVDFLKSRLALLDLPTPGSVFVDCDRIPVGFTKDSGQAQEVWELLWTIKREGGHFRYMGIHTTRRRISCFLSGGRIVRPVFFLDPRGRLVLPRAVRKRFLLNALKIATGRAWAPPTHVGAMGSTPNESWNTAAFACGARVWGALEDCGVIVWLTAGEQNTGETLIRASPLFRPGTPVTRFMEISRTGYFSTIALFTSFMDEIGGNRLILAAGMKLQSITSEIAARSESNTRTVRVRGSAPIIQSAPLVGGIGLSSPVHNNLTAILNSPDGVDDGTTMERRAFERAQNAYVTYRKHQVSALLNKTHVTQRSEMNIQRAADSFAPISDAKLKQDARVADSRAMRDAWLQSASLLGSISEDHNKNAALARVSKVFTVRSNLHILGMRRFAVTPSNNYWVGEEVSGERELAVDKRTGIPRLGEILLPRDVLFRVNEITDGQFLRKRVYEECCVADLEAVAIANMRPEMAGQIDVAGERQLFGLRWANINSREWSAILPGPVHESVLALEKHLSDTLPLPERLECLTEALLQRCIVSVRVVVTTRRTKHFCLADKCTTDTGQKGVSCGFRRRYEMPMTVQGTRIQQTVPPSQVFRLTPGDNTARTLAEIHVRSAGTARHPLFGGAVGTVLPLTKDTLDTSHLPPSTVALLDGRPVGPDGKTLRPQNSYNMISAVVQNTLPNFKTRLSNLVSALFKRRFKLPEPEKTTLLACILKVTTLKWLPRTASFGTSPAYICPKARPFTHLHTGDGACADALDTVTWILRDFVLVRKVLKSRFENFSLKIPLTQFFQMKEIDQFRQAQEAPWLHFKGESQLTGRFANTLRPVRHDGRKHGRNLQPLFRACTLLNNQRLRSPRTWELLKGRVAVGMLGVMELDKFASTQFKSCSTGGPVNPLTRMANKKGSSGASALSNMEGDAMIQIGDVAALQQIREDADMRVVPVCTRCNNIATEIKQSTPRFVCFNRRCVKEGASPDEIKLTQLPQSFLKLMTTLSCSGAKVDITLR